MGGHKRCSFGKSETDFKGSEIQITTEGRPYFGAPLGVQEYLNKFFMAKVGEWIEEVIALSKMAGVHFHAVYVAMTHSLIHR